MDVAVHRMALLLVAILVCGITVFAADEARAHEDAISGVVSGQQIQKVGFRAMIQKQAIMLNLAGSARNNPNGTVSISLQGDSERIDKALEAIRAGSKKSSRDNNVSVTNSPLDPNLRTFTVFGWTSTSRNIANPYDLIFHLRPTDDELSKKRAEAAWNAIAESTLKGDDLRKFMNHLGGAD
ncbi:MAG TPA: acylphosphatase [Roseiarcus sp.]|jgi:acylphosphatase